MLSNCDLENKIVSKEHRFVYGVIQKNASTSVIATLNRLYYRDAITGTPYQMLEATPKNNKMCQLSQYSEDEINEILNDPHFYKVTTLRDPYERFISACMTKLVEMPNFIDQYGVSDDKIVNLHNAMEFILNTPDNERNIHFRSQYLMGNFDTIKYKRVMHVRNLYHNWNLLRKDKPGIPKLGKIRNATHSNEFVQILNNYHPHAKLKIMRMYQVDYDLFKSYDLKV